MGGKYYLLSVITYSYSTCPIIVMRMLEKVISLLILFSCTRSTYSGNKNYEDLFKITTSNSDDFFNNRRNVRDIAVRNDSDAFYVLADNLFNPSLEIFDGNTGGIRIPSDVPISFYCAVCVRKESLLSIDMQNFHIGMSLDNQHKKTYNNYLNINTDKYQCLTELLSIPDGFQRSEEQYLTCTIDNLFNNTHRYIYNYINVEDRANAILEHFDMFKVPIGTNYLTCKKTNKKDRKEQIFFWGKLVEHKPKCREIPTNDKSYDDLPEIRVSEEIAKYKIIPILENGAQLSIVNQVQVTDLDDIFSDKIVCINYNHLTNGKKKSNIRIVVWYLENNVPNIVSVPIKANNSCIYPFAMYSIRNPSRLIEGIKHQPSPGETTMALKDILTITGYCFIVFLCILIIICVILNRDTLCLCTVDRRNGSRRQDGSYKEDFERVLNTDMFDESTRVQLSS